MTIKLFVKLQTPTIELKVSAKDASGATDALLVGFKRYELTESQEKLNKLLELMKAKEDSTDISDVDTFIKDEIVYIKQSKLSIEEDGKEKELTIPDTRTAKPVAGLWETGLEALDVLTSLYLASNPYRLALIIALQKALFNSDLSEGEAKN
jgi:hypothetical protein